jgi:integral membrane protein
MLRTPLKQVRFIGIIEGYSFLLLLFIAMPLKYFFDLPIAVSIVGALHGALFVLYIAAILYVVIAIRWSLWKAFIAGLASIVPFGPFIIDNRLYTKDTH